MFEYFVYNYGMELIGLLLVAIAGCVGVGMRNLFNVWLNHETGRINTDIKVTIARTAAAFVEQVWKDLHGAQKMQKALETAQELLAKKGISFDADEMMVLIEAAVSEFNEAFHKPVDSETVKGSYRVPEEPTGFESPGE